MSFVRIKGTQVQKTPSHCIHIIRGVGESVNCSGAPLEGATMPSPKVTTTLPPMYVSVETDDLSEPGRVFFTARAQAPWTDAEAYPK